MLRLAVLAWGLCSLLGGAASARSLQTFSYPFDEVYSAAVRLLRVDRGCSITDRDPQAAYVLFECKEDKRVRRGALELIRIEEGARAQLSLLDEPSYMEVRLLELLGRKLREERGAPAPARGGQRGAPDGGAR